MKNIYKVLGIIVCAALIGFFTIGCNNGSQPGDGTPTAIVISGTLSNQPAARRNARAAAESGIQTFSATVGSDNKTLSGKLKDGSITFELSGQYDASTKVFSMQAPSSFIIFSIAGKLTSANAIDANATSASVKMKDSSTREWTSMKLTVSGGSQTVDGEINADTSGVTPIPMYCQGTFVDQISYIASEGFYTLKYTVTDHSITMFDGDNAPQDITVVEVTNADGSPADENGPWHFIINAEFILDGSSSPVPYIGIERLHRKHSAYFLSVYYFGYFCHVFTPLIRHIA